MLAGATKSTAVIKELNEEKTRILKYIPYGSAP